MLPQIESDKRRFHVAQCVVCAIVLTAFPLHAQRVARDYETNDIRQWVEVHCGGNGFCPCTTIANWGAGTCYNRPPPGTQDSAKPLPPGGRFQIDTVQKVQGTAALKVTLLDSDHWPNDASSNIAQCTADPSACTTRNELAADDRSFAPGDERWFLWYTRFGDDPANCASAGTCWPLPPTTDPGANVFHVFTQLHHSGDNGSPPILLGLNMNSSGTDYEIKLASAQTDTSFDTDREDHWTAPLSRGHWHTFVLHVKFSDDPSVGFFELWHALDGAAPAKQTLKCYGNLLPNPFSQSFTMQPRCVQRTLYSPCNAVSCVGNVETAFLAQGLYRSRDFTVGKEVLWHDGTSEGMTSTDIVPPECCNGLACNAADRCGLGATCGAGSGAICGGSVTLTVSKAGTGAGTVTSSPAGINCGATCSAQFAQNSSVTLTAAVAAGSSFAGFTGPCTASGTTCTATMDVAKTITATFSQTSAAIATLTDRFDQTAIDATRWTVVNATNGTASEGGGALVLAPNASTGTAQIVVVSNQAYSLIGSSAMVQAVSHVTAGCNVNDSFQLAQAGAAGNRVQWWYECGSLSAMYAINGTETTLASLPYSAAAHAFLRIRESAGTVFWETSADGTTWVARAQTAAITFALTSLNVRFYSETFATGSPSPGKARFVNLNVAPTCGGSCVAQLSDPFSGTSIDPRWSVSAVSGTATESGGTLNLSPNAGTGSAQIVVTSTGAFSLASSFAQAQITSVVNAGCNVNNSLQLTQAGAAGNRLQWWFECGNLYAMYAVSGTETTLATLAYSATAHAWWRIRQTNGVAYWETSPDGATWVVQASKAWDTAPFALTSMNVRFYSETYGTGVPSPPGPGTAKYRNLN